MPKRYASIDIGTNTLRLLIAEYATSSHGMKPLGYKRIVTRLGGSFTDEEGIDKDSAERTFQALEEFKRDIEAKKVDQVIAVATSAVREAKNSEWFVDEVLKRTGIKVDVISGAEEARLSFFGVMFVLFDKSVQNKKRLVMDIGGGSTEFIASTGVDINAMWSTELGVVHLTEKYLKSDPPTADELKALNEKIVDDINDLKKSMAEVGIEVDDYSSGGGVDLVGTAGTITTLAALEQELEIYNPQRINNFIINKDRLKALYENLSTATIEERLTLKGLESGREDLIVAGAAIARKVAEEFGFSILKVSDGGLLEGILLKEIWQTDGLGA